MVVSWSDLAVVRRLDLAGGKLMILDYARSGNHQVCKSVKLCSLLCVCVVREGCVKGGFVVVTRIF